MRVVTVILAALAVVASAAASTGLRGTSPLSKKDMDAVRFLRVSAKAKEGSTSESAAELTTCFREHVQMFDRGTANVIDACARIMTIKCAKSASAAAVTQCWRDVARPICAGSVEGLEAVQRVRLSQLRAAEQQRQASHRNKIAMRSLAGDETRALSPVDREYLKLDGSDPSTPEGEVEEEQEVDGNSETLAGDDLEEPAEEPEEESHDFSEDSTEEVAEESTDEAPEESNEDSFDENEEESTDEAPEESNEDSFDENEEESTDEAPEESNEDSFDENENEEEGEDSTDEGSDEASEDTSEEDAALLQNSARTHPKHGGKHGAKNSKQGNPHVGPDELESISQRWEDIKSVASGKDLEKAKAARIRPGFQTSFVQTTARGSAVSVAILDALETTCSLRHYKGE